MTTRTEHPNDIIRSLIKEGIGYWKAGNYEMVGKCENILRTQYSSTIFPETNIKEEDEKCTRPNISNIGVIAVNSTGCTFGKMIGESREILHHFNVVLPMPHGRGHKSNSQFERLRKEKRNSFLKNISEAATRLFMSDDKPNIEGLVLVGDPSFFRDIRAPGLLHGELNNIITKEISSGYGLRYCFDQAADLIMIEQNYVV